MFFVYNGKQIQNLHKKFEEYIWASLY